MRRSEINRIIRDAHAFIESFRMRLPPFAHWSPDQLRANIKAAPAILANRLGWDITDFGSGKFGETGLVLFTARNGAPDNLANGRGMVYAEKVMIARDKQYTPMHRHNIKTEDIINRGGGRLVVELYAAKSDGSIDPKAGVTVMTDAKERTLLAGSKLALAPGESVTLHPNHWHGFWGDKDVLVGEVSSVNDDLTDNVFRDKVGRFAKIEEDETPLHLLVSDYETWLR